MKLLHNISFGSEKTYHYFLIEVMKHQFFISIEGNQL